MMLIVAYDISDDKRRNSIFKILKDYGQWMQYSLFECDLTQDKYSELCSKLKNKINRSEDSIKFYFICSSCLDKSNTLGQDNNKEQVVVV